jgi:betaine lipid synthase
VLKNDQIGGGTGYNIEAMQAHLDVPVPEFFSRIYLVDLSPSLCDIARKRFARLGWNIRVICQDARAFRLEDQMEGAGGNSIAGAPVCTTGVPSPRFQADLITMSYSLSMIPDYYSVVDSLTGLLAPGGLIGVVDFYVQSIVETAGRNYIGGSFNRHVNWLSRVIWRSWFDCDRVGLEGARRVSCWRDDVDPSVADYPWLGLSGIPVWNQKIR